MQSIKLCDDRLELHAEIDRLQALCQEAVVCMRCCNGDKTPEVLSLMRRLAAACKQRSKSKRADPGPEVTP